CFRTSNSSSAHTIVRAECEDFTSSTICFTMARSMQRVLPSQSTSHHFRPSSSEMRSPKLTATSSIVLQQRSPPSTANKAWNCSAVRLRGLRTRFDAPLILTSSIGLRCVGMSPRHMAKSHRTCSNDLLHGEETRVWGDQAYRGKTEVIRECAPQAQDCTHRRYRYKDRIDEVERAKNRTKSTVRSKVEHVFAVMKLKFGFVKLRYRGLKKNATQLFAVCALV